MTKFNAIARQSTRNHKRSQNLTNLTPPPPPPPPTKKSGYGPGKDIFSVCVNKYFLFVLTVRLPRPYISSKPVRTSLQWHKFLQMHHSFVFCHFLSIPSKIHLLVWVKSFQQHAFSRKIYLHSFTELFHKIFPCSSEQIAIIHENYL